MERLLHDAYSYFRTFVARYGQYTDFMVRMNRNHVLVKEALVSYTFHYVYDSHQILVLISQLIWNSIPKAPSSQQICKTMRLLRSTNHAKVLLVRKDKCEALSIAT